MQSGTFGFLVWMRHPQGLSPSGGMEFGLPLPIQNQNLLSSLELMLVLLNTHAHASVNPVSHCCLIPVGVWNKSLILPWPFLGHKIIHHDKSMENLVTPSRPFHASDPHQTWITKAPLAMLNTSQSCLPLKSLVFGSLMPSNETQFLCRMWQVSVQTPSLGLQNSGIWTPPSKTCHDLPQRDNFPGTATLISISRQQQEVFSPPSFFLLVLTN